MEAFVNELVAALDVGGVDERLLEAIHAKVAHKIHGHDLERLSEVLEVGLHARTTERLGGDPAGLLGDVDDERRELDDGIISASFCTAGGTAIAFIERRRPCAFWVGRCLSHGEGSGLPILFRDEDGAREQLPQGSGGGKFPLHRIGAYVFHNLGDKDDAAAGLLGKLLERLRRRARGE